MNAGIKNTKKMHIKCLTSAFKEIFHPVRLPRLACGSELMLNQVT